MEQIECLSQVVKQLQDNIRCPICFDILTEPVSTKCNHHFCSECFKKLFKIRGSQKCPVCLTSLTRRSCVKNSDSLNPIVYAVRNLIENLIADTGIDFPNVTSVRTSTKEATCNNEINKQLLNNNQNEKPQKDVLKRDDKNLKQYNRKPQSKNVEDSFMFPADFIQPKKSIVAKGKETSESATNKVSSWLTENDKDFKECDDLSILNGSLPKKLPVDLNVSSLSEEELLSVSQVNTNCNIHLAPLKYKTDLEVIESSEKSPQVEIKSPEFKDPYEFISSQKSNDAQKLKVTRKRNTRSYGTKRKPLGLDISRLVNEPYTKKKKMAMNDSLFQVPEAINDTFDQLFAGNKKCDVTSSVIKKTISKGIEGKQGNSSGDVLIFQSQNNLIDEEQITETTTSDFSSDSDEDWAQTKKKTVKGIVRRRSERVFKSKSSKPKVTRKSTGNKERKIEKEFLETINKTFEEIQNHKLMTSSQVMREEMSKNQGVPQNKKSSLKNGYNTHVAKESDGDIEEIIEVKSPIKEGNLSHKDNSEHTHSPGWSRVDDFKNKFDNNNKLPMKSQLMKNDKAKNYSALSNNKSDTVLDKARNSRAISDISNINRKLILPGKKSAKSSHQSKKEDEQSFRKSDKPPIQSPEPSVWKASCSSPGEPVRFLDLSQSEERAQIMNNVVMSYESSLQEEERALSAAASGQSKISVCMGNLPDEDESMLSDCIKDCSTRRALNISKLDLLSCERNTPVNVVMSCDTEICFGNANMINSSDAQLQDTEGNFENHIVPPTQAKNKLGNKTTGEDRILLSSSQPSHVMLVEMNFKNKVGSLDTFQDTISSQNCSQALDKGHYQSKCGENREPMKICSALVTKDITDGKKNSLPSEKFGKGILSKKCVEKHLKLTTGIADSSDIVDKESPVVRRVHFAEASNEKESEEIHVSESSKQCVSFFKIGSCSVAYRKSKVKFLFLGSCVKGAEEESEVSEWLIKVSKNYPVCFCGNNNTNLIENADNDQNTFAPLVKVCEDQESKTMWGTELVVNTLQHDTHLQSRENNMNLKSAYDIQQTTTPLANSCENQENKTTQETELPINILQQNTQLHLQSNVNTTNPVKRTDNVLQMCSSLMTSNEDEENNFSPIKILKSMSNENTYDNGIQKSVSSDGFCKSQLSQPIQKSDEDVFRSYENNKMHETFPEKCSEIVSNDDDFKTDESDRILPFQQLHEKDTDEEIFQCEQNKVCDLSGKRNAMKPSDVDIFASNQKNESCALSSETFSGPKKDTMKLHVNMNLLNNDACSADDDIFESDEVDYVIVPPYQEIQSSNKTKETVSDDSPKSASKSNEDITLQQRMKLSVDNQNSDMCEKGKGSKTCVQFSSVHMDSEDMFKTEEKSAGSQRCVKNTSEENISSLESLKRFSSSESNHKAKAVSPLEKMKNPFCRVSRDISKRSFVQRKRVRPLSESSDDSDPNEQVKKTYNESYTEELVDGRMNRHKYLNVNVGKDIQNTEVDDCLLNSEELLKRVINNINEDLGYSKRSEQGPKLKGAKKEISSESDDCMEIVETKYQKLSNSPEYDVQNSIHLDSDVFDDVEADNDGDIIESTPMESKIEDVNYKKDSCKETGLFRDAPVDGSDKDTQDSLPDKFVLPQSSYSNLKSSLMSKSVPSEISKKLDRLAHHVDEVTSKTVSLPQHKETTITSNLFGSPRKTIDTSEKNSSEMCLNNIQKSIGEVRNKPLTSVAKDNIRTQNRMVLVCSGLKAHFVTILKKFAEDIGAEFSNNFIVTMTHLIVSVDENRATPKTLKYLQAVAAKKWVVSFDWVTASVSAKRLLPEEDFEVIDTVGLDGPRRSRLSSESLFKNVQACFIEPFENITVDQLQEVFMMCGGMVVDSPEGLSIASSKVLRIIIVDNDAKINSALCQKWITLNRAVTLNYDWLVDCIGTYSILPVPSSFAAPFTREQVLACGFPEHLLDEEYLEITGVSEMSDSNSLLAP